MLRLWSNKPRLWIPGHIDTAAQTTGQGRTGQDRTGQAHKYSLSFASRLPYRLRRCAAVELCIVLRCRWAQRLSSVVGVELRVDRTGREKVCGRDGTGEGVWAWGWRLVGDAWLGKSQDR
jgi:hypothetical protein